MSLLGIFGPSPQPTGKPGGRTSNQPPPAAQPAEQPRDPAPAAPSGSGGTGGTAPAEQTTAPPAAAQTPPPAPARPTNASSSSRPGADGKDAAAAAHEAQDTRAASERRAAAALATVQADDARFELTEAQARRFAEATRDKLVAQELLSRIPVPVAALPKLGAALEAQVDRPEPMREVRVG